jgi:hypothetical protein
VVGRKVYPQETLIVLPDTSVMVAAVKVHETLAGRIKPGMAATVKIDAYPGRVFTGEVDSIGVMAESQGRWMDPNRREYTIKIALDKPEASGGAAGAGSDVSLKPAMRCEATLTLGRVDDARTVPLQAVFADEAVKFVYTPQAGKYARVPVQVGRRSDTTAEITAGLDEGQRVLVREPSAGEVLRTPWDAAQLTLVGLRLGSDGKPVPVGGPDREAGTRRPARAARPGAPAEGKVEGKAEARAPETKPAVPETKPTPAAVEPKQGAAETKSDSK